MCMIAPCLFLFSLNMFRESVEITPIVGEIVGNSLRWFGHVERKRADSSVVRRVD